MKAKNYIQFEAMVRALLNGDIGAEGSYAEDPLRWVFQDEHIIGNGSFGVVYQAIVQGSQPQKVSDLATFSCAMARSFSGLLVCFRRWQSRRSCRTNASKIASCR